MFNRMGLIIAVALVGFGGRPGAAEPASAEFFESQVRPVLAANCFECHGPKKQESDVRLDSREAMLTGNSDGPVIVPGDPEKSRLVKAIRRKGEIKMPPEKTLPEPAVEALATGSRPVRRGPRQKRRLGVVGGRIDRGDGEAALGISTGARAAVARRAECRVGEELRSIAFVLARLEAAHIPPAPAADRRTLIRRATFDLIGLPPTPDEVDDFLATNRRTPLPAWSIGCWPRRATASAGGGYWLDVARYADTKGYVFMEDRQVSRIAYVYRDWVIEALNDDMPYDKFLVEQIAADRSAGQRQWLAGGDGFLDGRPAVSRTIGHDIIDDRLDVISRGMMGLTVTCARCHDHKFDPIPTEDYYSLYGVLASSVEKQVPLAPQSPEQAMVLEDAPTPENPHVFVRGNAGNIGAAVPRQFLAVLSGPDRKPFRARERAIGIGPADRVARQPAHGPRARQSRLAASFRRGLGSHAERFRPAQRAADASRAARLSGGAIRRRRLVAQEAASADHAFEHVSAIEQRLCGRAEERSGEPAALENEPPPIGFRGHARCAAGGRRRHGPENRRTIDRSLGAAVLAAAERVWLDRSPKPAGPVPHVRSGDARHDQPAAAHDDRPAAGAVPDEQPVCRRASSAAA